MKRTAKFAAPPKWRRVPEPVRRTFVDAVARLNGAEVRKMFGCPAAFINGNMLAGVHQESVLVRLPEEARRAALEKGWCPFEPMPGRVMREYVVLPNAVVSKKATLDSWLAQALAYAASLPPKARKTQREKRPRAVAPKGASK
jgi:TfoX/Sxy family transcriptional regulator of competence genes